MSEDEAPRAVRLEALEHALGHRFGNRGLLEQALRHSSFAHERALDAEAKGERADIESNERLEFLGDAVLELVVAESLFAAKPDWREGDLTRALHAIVEGRSLADLARRLELGAVLRLGRTEESSSGHEKPRVLEDAMEAVIGALYLDGGLDAARSFLTGAFADALAADAGRTRRDPKTELQERLMADHGELPSYRLAEDSGVEGDDERFAVEVLFQADVLGRGVGRTKRTAEKRAAEQALEARTASGGEV